jgi:hypothetical protein
MGREFRSHATPSGAAILVEVGEGENFVRLKSDLGAPCEWFSPECASLAVAFVRFGEAIQPLLDWCLEHADEPKLRAKVESLIADVSPGP